MTSYKEMLKMNDIEYQNFIDDNLIRENIVDFHPRFINLNRFYSKKNELLKCGYDENSKKFSDELFTNFIFEIIYVEMTEKEFKEEQEKLLEDDNYRFLQSKLKDYRSSWTNNDEYRNAINTLKSQGLDIKSEEFASSLYKNFVIKVRLEPLLK